MDRITGLDAPHAHGGTPGEAARIKVTPRLAIDEPLRARFGKDCKCPCTVIVIAIPKVYSPCAR